MATIDQQFVEYIVKTLVNNPDEVAVERKIDEKGVLLSLTVSPEDIGRVIGKRGATAQAIRVLLRALGTKQDARYNLKIVNNDEGEQGQRSGNTDSRREDTVTDDDASEDVNELEEAGAGTSDSEEKSSDLAEKTRAELADLDDLDI